MSSLFKSLTGFNQSDMEVQQTGSHRIYYWFAFGALILIILALNATLAMHTIRDLAETQRSLINNANVLTKIKDLHKSVLAAETGQRGYLLTQDASYLQPYDDALSVLDGQVDQVREIATEIEGQKARIDLVLDLIELKRLELIETVSLALNEEHPRALSELMTNRGRNLYREIHDLFKAIEKAEVRLRENRFAQLREAQSEATWVFIVSGSLSIILVIGLLVVALLNIRKDTSYRQDLEESNQRLADLVEERTRELQLYSEELSRSNRELEDFAFVASHDLQEPLRKIQAFGERLDNQFTEALGERGSDYLSRMRNAASRMSRLISDLLDYSRVSTRGKAFEEVDLNETLETIIDDLEVRIEERHATLKLDKLPVIRADANQMYQLFLNLLGNSLKFSKPDQTPHIDVTYALNETEDADYHIVCVSDNGIGFDTQYADKIFLPFQRLHGRDQYQGTGIGLAVCRRIVERHGGTLTAISEPGKGTQMRISLPTLGVEHDELNPA